MNSPAYIKHFFWKTYRFSFVTDSLVIVTNNNTASKVAKKLHLTVQKQQKSTCQSITIHTMNHQIVLQAVSRYTALKKSIPMCIYLSYITFNFDKFNSLD